MGHIMTMRIYLSGRVAIELDGQVFIDQNQFRDRQGRLLFACLDAKRTHPGVQTRAGVPNLGRHPCQLLGERAQRTVDQNQPSIVGRRGSGL